MKTITKYEANDGTQFTAADKCLIYEIHCRLADEAVAVLHPRPKDMGFANGEGYIQHDLRNVALATSELKSLATGITGIDCNNRHFSHAARFVEEGAGKHLAEVYYRMMCIDEHGRECGQPYYALNPGEGVNKKLN